MTPDAAFPNSAMQPGGAPFNAARRTLIVIPCLNEQRFIGGLLKQLLADEALVDPLIVVADGGSRDASRSIVQALAREAPQIRLLDNPARLQSAGVNLAARLYGQDRPWLIRIDAHATYPDGYASALVEQALSREAASIVVAMDTVGAPGFQRGVAIAQTSALGTGGSAHRVAGATGWVDHGHHALFSTPAFLASGGYDESFSHNEDAELDLRLAQAGGKIWLTDQPRVTYYPRDNPAALWRQYFAYGRGRMRTVLKHRARLRPRQTLPLLVAPALVLAAVSPWFGLAAAPATLWAIACLGFGLLLAVRRRDPWGVLAGPAAMIMHAAWSFGAWRQRLTHGFAVHAPAVATESPVL